MYEGSCLCGAVRFAVHGEVSPLQYCHCARCQKVSGGACVAAVAARSEAVRFTAGAELVRTCVLPVRAEPPSYRTAFCGQCGAPVPILAPEQPFAVIPAGAFDGAPPLRPMRHIFVAQNPAWHVIGGDLPRFPEHVPPEQRLPTRR
ncbi:MAG: GFA family protein [bacterium]